MKAVNSLPDGNKNSNFRFGGWGWLTILYCMVMFFFYVGMVNDGTNFFAPAMSEKLGILTADILSANSAAGLGGIVFFIVLSRACKTVGPAKIAGLCCIVAGLAYWGCAMSTSLVMYGLCMCAVAGTIMTAGFVGGGALVAQWFPKKKGVVMGYTTMGLNLASAFYVPLIMVLINSMGVETGTMPIAVACAILGVLILLTQKNSPFDRNQNPDNVSDSLYAAEYDTEKGDDNVHGWTVGKLLRTKELWVAAITTGGFQICSVGVMTQLITRNVGLGFTTEAATSIMTVLALGGVVGSWIIGLIDNKIGTKPTMIGFGIWYAAALICNYTNNMTLVYISLFMIAMGIGGSANFTTSLPTSIFGRHGFDVVNSVCFPIQGALTALCFAVNAAVMYTFDNNIRNAYVVFAVVALCVSALVCTIDEHKYNLDWQKAKKG